MKGCCVAAWYSDPTPAFSELTGFLAGGADPDADRAIFLLAQLAFWLLAAIDGHAKNFSIHHHRGGTYKLTPLYDVLSAWPVIGHGRNQLPFEKAKLAMAIRGRRPHDRLDEITGRHWRELTAQAGVPNVWERMQELVGAVPKALERLGTRLPRGFPERVYGKIRAGTLGQSRRFADTAAAA